ncbi:adenylate/guanylate cyclase domain-containing protein [Kiloniella antarctica]|uniref:Adenylate/guanylate cyclase domain-containing protein n=1 Tax=Kiloniella antarctica TaxID=1550907 RepID=A0ABW5BJR4_9PROT
MKWFSSVNETALPERVLNAIHEQENQTEQLIGWIQLAVVTIFGTLYLISPKTFNEDVTFAPVPWALAIYLALTIIRIVWSYNLRMPDWSLALSALFDMTLLMVLIWSFHIQYNQPPSFYLKVPTLLYVFIFIAIRALRFEAKFVIIAGLFAAIGWGLMILYVVKIDSMDSMITRNYVQYMTSNSILLGAEFDKIISILIVTLILAVALIRARRLLIHSVSERQAAEELSRFFSPEIAAKIAHSEDKIMAGIAERREAAIMNLDMRGFTKMASQETVEVVMGTLAEYQQLCVPIIQKHGGSIDKFMGDGIMATFGASEPSKTYAADALRAMDELMEATKNWRREEGLAVPLVNGSVAVGSVLFGAVGDDSRLEYTVIGDAVNLSAKLEKHNKDVGARALADDTAYKRALEQGYEPKSQKKRLENNHIMGISKPLDLVVVAE